MVTLAIVAIMLTFSLPAYTTLIDGSQNRKTTDSLRASIAQTRSESITRGGNVRLCGSRNGTTCTNSLNDGWLVYYDSDADDILTGADTVLTWHAIDYENTTISGVNGSGVATTEMGFNYRGYPTQAITLAVNVRAANSTVQLFANGRVIIQ